jgi:magnesium transporter
MALLGNGPGRRLGLRAPVRGADEVTTSPPDVRDAVVDWALYRDGVRVPAESYADAVRLATDGGGFVWVGLHEPDEAQLAGVAQEFGLHPLAVEDAVQAHQRPKLERYDDMLFAVLKTVRYCAHDTVTDTAQIVATGEVMVFLGERFVVTVRHGEHGALGEVRQRLEDDPALLSLGPSAVLYGVADAVVDDYLEVVELVQDDLDEIEETVFSGTRQRAAVGRIYQVKRELLEFRRAVTPLAQPLRALAERPVPLVDEQIREYFRDAEDHLTRAREALASFDELLTSILQAGLAQLSIAENEDMRKITAWAAIIAVPTAITGVYGMNFDHMPELGTVWGYPLTMLIIATTCVVLYRRFKRIGWL